MIDAGQECNRLLCSAAAIALGAFVVAIHNCEEHSGDPEGPSGSNIQFFVQAAIAIVQAEVAPQEGGYVQRICFIVCSCHWKHLRKRL